ncbi:unnamed protein product [Aureobasidium mustum]|uniref:Peroxisome membrane anchor protein Pex14p N-terminal domain-containing protein n=1 Tax=Aureobasidium mustum TaxID=2773714 RepID=A0A9N8JWI2_9PEZI|nr:unnamed protein product [Aureobasidium mustum]
MSEKKDLPAWQRHATDASTQAAIQEHDANVTAIDRVRRFLQDPAVKDAPYDRKKAFLLTKDVSEEMIYQVMGEENAQHNSDTNGSKVAAQQEFHASKTTPTTDGSSEAAQQEFDATKKVPQPESYVKTTDGSQEAANQEFEASKKNPQPESYNKTTTDGSQEASKQEFDASKKIPQPERYVKTTDGSQEAANQEFDASKAVSFSAADFRSQAKANAPQPRRDVPPIVTYPEFLVQPQKPPPLVTVSRLINATYIAGALTASAYALSKYIIAPMADNLNDARHDLFEHTGNHVSGFNNKLTKLVSTVPSSAKSLPSTPADLADFDTDSITSDPTELFHRDVGTQTSPSLSRRTSISSDTEVMKPDTVPLKQANRLEIMKSHLSELLEGTENNGTSNQTLQTSISETRHYLDGLYYTPPSYSWNADNSLNASNASKDKQPDAAVTLKAEIRGVKGVLLSAKRFPSVGRGWRIG